MGPRNGIGSNGPYTIGEVGSHDSDKVAEALDQFLSIGSFCR